MRWGRGVCLVGGRLFSGGGCLVGRLVEAGRLSGGAELWWGWSLCMEEWGGCLVGGASGWGRASVWWGRDCQVTCLGAAGGCLCTWTLSVSPGGRTCYYPWKQVN